MFGYIKDHLLYIKCPKNACMTYSHLLEQHNWQRIDLFENNLQLSDFILWGHITEPYHRHTRGVEQYLKNNPQINVHDPLIGQLLVSAVFDEHTYSLSMMLGPLWYQPIYWIPLDADIVNCTVDATIMTGDDLTNEFFKEQGLDLRVTLRDRLNVSVGSDSIRNKINELKIQHADNWAKIAKNFLELDLLRYNQTVDFFRNKYGTPGWT